MERSGTDYDIVTCPFCKGRDGLTIKWLPDIDHGIRERTDVGCMKCDKWFSGKEDRWAFARWNAFAVAEWLKQGRQIPHSELYRILLLHSEAEETASTYRKEADHYLEEHVASTCPFRTGDRFEAHIKHGGYWSVQNVRAVYGYNTGPFWIIEACEVLPSGRLGENRKEFWQRDASRLKLLPPFWKASRWSHVVAGDECVLCGESGAVIAVEPDNRSASIAVKGETRIIHTLSELHVPIVRVETGGT